MSLAYLVNRYPAVTHTFIAREIRGLEADGFRVHRFALRRAVEPPRSAVDQGEFTATRVALDAGCLKILAEVVSTSILHPFRVFQALDDVLRTGLCSQRGVIAHFAYLAYACVLRHWCMSERVDHLHVHMGGNAAMVAVLCNRLGGPPFSFTVHGPEEFENVDGISLALKIRRAVFVVGISAFAVSQLKRHCPPELWSRIHLIRCGVETQWITHNATRPPDAPHFVCVGRLCAAKMQHVLLEALALLARQGREVTLTLIGDGPTRPLIEERISALGLDQQVQLIGWADEDRVMCELDAARALVLPSAAEGLPVVIMEAFATCRPVISTFVAGIPELVKPGLSGWLVPVGTVDHLATAMVAAIDASPDELLAMGRAGHQAVQRRHDARRNAQVLSRLFRGDPSVET